MRIAVAGFQHETNSFAPGLADLDWFLEHRDRPPLVTGDAVLAALRDGSYGLSGFLATIEAGVGDADETGRIDILPLVWASGGAGPTVTDRAFDHVVGELLGRLAAAAQAPGAGAVDAIYLDLHGAMVTESHDDAEGELLARLRAVVGPDVPIAVSLDYHANLSPRMLALSDVMLVCQTYPHVDRAETGARTAQALLRRLQGRALPGRALRKPDFLLPLDAQCTLVEPSRSLVAPVLVDDPATVELAYAAGFPPSDTHWCGPGLLVRAQTQAAADALADAWLARFMAAEPRFRTPLWSSADGVAEARRRVAAGAVGPVLLADTCDNPGAGGSGDTTGVLQALLNQDADGALLGYLCDASAAAAAESAGVGATLDLALGGRHGPAGVEPVRARFTVLRCASGPFRMTGQVAGRVTADLGAMALLQCRGVQIAVTSRRVQAYDPAPFAQLGADPARARILVLKSSCHFRADFEPLADSVLTVLAPGAYDPDPSRAPYRRLRDDVRFGPGAPAAGRRSPVV